jgi:hypothetical protein
MKGYLKKTEEGWFVIYDQRTMQYPSAEDGILPLEPEMANYLNMNLTSTTFEKEKEFEEITLVDKLDSYQNCIFKTYAKLVEPEKDRTCNHTNCIEVCPECKPYFISDDCEEVKNWDNFVEQKNLELLAEEVYGKGIKPDYEEGFVDGYNKAKETLYTEFDIIKAFEYGWNQRHYGIDDEMLLREIQNNLIKSLKQD